MGAQKFTTTVEAVGPGGAWTRIALPFDVPNIVWITSAKHDETRRRRIAKAVDRMATGKRFSDK